MKGIDMTARYEELRKGLKIDKLELDSELIQQPERFEEVGDQYVSAAAIRDAAKEELKIVDADLYNEIREEFEKEGKKPTEAQIQNEIVRDKSHRKAMKEYHEAKEAADRLENLKESYQMRSYMLRDLVSLHGANYFESRSAKGTRKTDEFQYEAREERVNKDKPDFTKDRREKRHRERI